MLALILGVCHRILPSPKSVEEMQLEFAIKPCVLTTAQWASAALMSSNPLLFDHNTLQRAFAAKSKQKV